jgi:hypothetical protein
MLMTYILFGFFIAGLSFYASFALDEARRTPAGARRNGRINPRNRITSSRERRASEWRGRAPEARAKWELAPQDVVASLPPLDFDPHDPNSFESGLERVQWGKFTLRELEERLAGDIEVLDSKSWKHES